VEVILALNPSLLPHCERRQKKRKALPPQGAKWINLLACPRSLASHLGSGKGERGWAKAHPAERYPQKAGLETREA